MEIINPEDMARKISANILREVKYSLPGITAQDDSVRTCSS